MWIDLVGVFFLVARQARYNSKVPVDRSFSICSSWLDRYIHLMDHIKEITIVVSAAGREEALSCKDNNYVGKKKHK